MASQTGIRWWEEEHTRTTTTHGYLQKRHPPPLLMSPSLPLSLLLSLSSFSLLSINKLALHCNVQTTIIADVSQKADLCLTRWSHHWLFINIPHLLIFSRSFSNLFWRGPCLLSREPCNRRFCWPDTPRFLKKNAWKANVHNYVLRNIVMFLVCFFCLFFSLRIDGCWTTFSFCFLAQNSEEPNKSKFFIGCKEAWGLLEQRREQNDKLIKMKPTP